MTDYIERGGIMALIEAEERLWGEDYDARQILGDIENYPAADVRPVVRGRWLPHPNSTEHMVCSVCNRSWHNLWCPKVMFTYCPDCGAKNKEDEG